MAKFGSRDPLEADRPEDRLLEADDTGYELLQQDVIRFFFQQFLTDNP
jgi:hypothetical protein